MSHQRILDSSLLNMAWSALSLIASKGVNLITTVVLARILSPEDFGLMAICLSIIVWFEIISRFGLGAAVISEREDPEGAAQAAFIISVGCSIAVAVGLAAGSGSLAAWFETPAVAAMLQVMCLGLVIDAASTVHASIIARSMQFRRRAPAEVGRGVVKGIVAIGLAFHGYGVWSLVWGFLAGAATYSVLMVTACDWAPIARAPSRAVTLRMMRFGSHLIVAELVFGTVKALPMLFVGKVFGPAAAGLFTVASRVPDLALKNMSFVVGQVGHPAMAQIGDIEGIRRYLVAALRSIMFLLLPAAALIAAGSEAMVRVLYTETWLPMIPIMHWLSLAFAIGAFGYTVGSAYKAANRPDLILLNALIGAPVFVGALVLSAPYGLSAVAMGQAIASIVMMAPHAVMLWMVLRMRFSEWLRALFPGVVTASVIATAGFAIGNFVSAPPLVEGAVIGVVGVSLWAAVGWLVAADLMEEAFWFLRRRGVFGRAAQRRAALRCPRDSS